MKRSIIFLALFLPSILLFAQGTENFANYPETGSSYHDGTFTGQDGSTWTYWQCRGDVVINPPTPCLGKDRTPTSEVISGVLQNGCGTLSFDYMQGFSTNVNLDVFVNGLLVATVTSSNQQGVVLNSGSIIVDSPGDFTLDFKQHNTSSGQVAIDNITWTEFGGAPLPEPSNYPTDFAAQPYPFSITLTWTDAVGPQLPTAYLIKASDQDNITLPADGTPVADDPDLSDGTGAMNILQGVETYTFYDLPSNQPFYFKIFPYTNTGSNIDYKTDGTPPSVMATTPNIVIINYENFNDSTLGTWSEHNIIGPQQFWEIDPIHGIAGSPCARMNGYSGGAVENEDWLISPAMNFDTYINEQLTFQTACYFDGPDLEVKISNEYDGVGDPNNYEWVDLSGTLSPGGWSWTPSGVVDVSGIGGNSVYVGFMYTSTLLEAKTWEVDEILITGEVVIGVPDPLKKNYSFHFFPNPAREQVTLRFPDPDEKVVTLLSILGLEVKHERITRSTCSISCTDLPPGVYFVRITGAGGETGVKKLIKE
ncbi:MAG: choice-of-anchor J domain-containing protein [Bacteroidales bacterium]|nr:choice-of-anchor J domain-containing protein [Bacteroidales bacterium]